MSRKRFGRPPTTAAELDGGFHDQVRIEEQITLSEVDARLAVQGFILAQVLGGTG